jgi:hypothetical protein
MSGTCSAHGGEERRIQVFVEKTEGKSVVQCVDLGGRRIIKKKTQEAGCRGMDWIDLAQDRDRRRALVNAVMNLRVP